MSAQLLDGVAIAKDVRSEVTVAAAAFTDQVGRKPTLAVVLVGTNPASQVYVGNKEKASRKVGLGSIVHRLPADVPQAELEALLTTLNNDAEVDGILLQLPLPDGFDTDRCINLISPAKDVDGLTYASAGRLASGAEGFIPCTPLGSMIMIKRAIPDLSGKRAVVIGRSILVGKPLGQLLLAANATVTMAHSRTADLPAVCREADILCAAVGRPEMVTPDYVKPGAVVIDIGINRVEDSKGEGRIVGDVDFDAVSSVAGWITPVPGGVGRMTIACLLRNTVVAAYRREGRPLPAELV